MFKRKMSLLLDRRNRGASSSEAVSDGPAEHNAPSGPLSAHDPECCLFDETEVADFLEQLRRILKSAGTPEQKQLLHPKDPLLRIDSRQFEFHKFQELKQSVNCVLKQAEEQQPIPPERGRSLKPRQEVELQYLWKEVEQSTDAFQRAKEAANSKQSVVVKLSKYRFSLTVVC